jgi:predicted membrane chloride channel (bestrophin family)
MLAAWPLLQLALMPSQAPTSLLHARAPRGPVAPGRLGTLSIRMVEVEQEQSRKTGILHQPFVDEKNPKGGKEVDRSNYKLLSGSDYAEESRQYRRTVYMHDEWVKHRSSTRFIRNLQTLSESGVGRALGTELGFITATAVFCVGINMVVHGYQDFSGIAHPSPLADLAFIRDIKQLSLPAFVFSIGMPALSLLLVFRTNTAYSRWNEARTLWGGVVNNCRNVVRQANIYYPDTAAAEELKDVLAANTAAFAKSLRNFLRGPKDDKVFRGELMEIVAAGLMKESQVDACMAAKNRPMFMLNAMSAALRKVDIDPIDRSRIDSSITTLVDLTGACERVFKSPVPLVYTRHTSRFLALFLLFLPFGLWPVMGDSWNHWATIPAADLIAFFLLGIEEIGIQIEEPFSILPLEALCNGAIAATIDELLSSKRDPSYTVGPAIPGKYVKAIPPPLPGQVIDTEAIAASAAAIKSKLVGTVQPVKQLPPVASYNNRDAWLVPLVNCGSSFLAGLVVFAALYAYA